MSFFARLFRIAPPAPAERDAALAAAGDAPAQARARNKRALELIAGGDRVAAAAELDAALALDPACVAAMVNTGNLELEAGRLAAAIARFEAAIALDPDYPEAHHNLGVALRRAGKRREAVRALRRATVLELRRRS